MEEERNLFPQDKDVAHKIMMQLPNEDLIKLCAQNRRLRDICYNYPDFWRNKFILDYGQEAAKYKPADRSWKNHYMQVFIDLQMYKKFPTEFLINIAWLHNIDESYFIDWENKKLIPLKEAPEWVLNNLYLLDLGIVRLVQYEPNGGLLDIPQELKNLKPIELLKIIKTPTPEYERYIVGLARRAGYMFRPDFKFKWQIEESFH